MKTKTTKTTKAIKPTKVGKMAKKPTRVKEAPIKIETMETNKSLLNKALLWLKTTFGPRGLEPLVQRQADQLILEMKKYGYDVVIFEGYRSAQRQDELYSQGRTRPGFIVTNAKGGESFHNYGVAVDIVFRGREPWGAQHPWKLLGKVGKSLGFNWGGDWKFKDLPHFELTLDYTLNDFQTGKVDYSRYV